MLCGIADETVAEPQPTNADESVSEFVSAISSVVMVRTTNLRLVCLCVGQTTLVASLVS